MFNNVPRDEPLKTNLLPKWLRNIPIKVVCQIATLGWLEVFHKRNGGGPYKGNRRARTAHPAIRDDSRGMVQCPPA